MLTLTWEKTQIIDAKTGKIAARIPYPELEEQFGNPYYLYHRVDLHNGLKSLALDTSSDSKPKTTLRLSSEIVNLDCENGLLTTKDGTKITKDLVVVADGVHVSDHHT